MNAAVSKSLAVFCAVASMLTFAFAATQSAGVVLPTEWTLSPPASAVTATKTFPQSAVLTADRRHLVVLEGGAGTPGIRILSPLTLDTERDIPVKGAYGVPLADARGAGFWASTGGGDALVHYDAGDGSSDRTFSLPKGFWGAALARSPNGKLLAVSGDLADAVTLLSAATGTALGDPIRVGRHPAGLAFSDDGKTLYVANWGGQSVSAIDVDGRSVRAEIPVGKHPEALVRSADGRRLFVSEADDDAIGVIDLATAKRSVDVALGLYGARLAGASPSALALSADGRRLYVACGAANAVAVLDVAQKIPRVVGALPAGWYPTALAFDASGTALDVVDGKGESGHPNPGFDPMHKAADPDTSGYVAASSIGSVRRVLIPDDAALARGLDTVRANAGPFLAHPPPRPEDTIVRPDGPLRHVIYVIKENRTYDQVLGDLPGADGDPKLALFGAGVTPNQHALAERFGILDNTYADAEVSADGHNWSMAGFANDYLERMWPQEYGGRRKLYDFEDGADASVPHSGYIWNAAARRGVSIRNYGEFTTEEAPVGTGPVTSQMSDLKDVTDPKFVGFDLSIRDEAREAEWEREFDTYVWNGQLPQLEIVRLPNDHTAGTRPGFRTPTAYVAENDLAVGRMVDKLSHSRYWADTVIFIVEDDAQNGPDHVDAQRMPAYVVSPYAAGGVHHEHYSTAGILRTIELILGLPPLSVYDASARPLDAAFTATPNYHGFVALPARVDLEATNGATAYRAAYSERADFSHEDGVPDAELNDVIWHAVRGVRSTPPPYGSFAR
jgi:YVTN family beta-propeller protein